MIEIRCPAGRTDPMNQDAAQLSRAAALARFIVPALLSFVLASAAFTIRASAETETIRPASQQEGGGAPTRKSIDRLAEDQKDEEEQEGREGQEGLKDQEEQEEANHQREYFQRWYGQMSPENFERMWGEVLAMPSEPPVQGAPTSVNSWQLLGPLYSVNPGGGQMTGRVRDIDAANYRVLAASGGLWRFYFGPVPMTEHVPASWFGSFASNPADANVILLATGEYGVGYGTGLYKTTDGGSVWSKESIGSSPDWFSRVRWNATGTVAYAASDYGVYVSTNGGGSWQRTLNGDATDVAPVPDAFYPNLAYVTINDQGLWRTTDAGTTWTQMTTGGIPSSATGHGAVSVMYPGQNQGVTIYASFATAGVWRTFDGGLNWTNITPNPDVNRFWYCNVIAVSPYDQYTVFLGGVGARYSHNGGNTWNPMVTPHLHADYHAFAFDPGGAGVWAGNDGGWSHSTDGGATWDTSFNVMPITQFYDVACERGEIGMMIGTSQDNNVEYTPNESLIWNLPAIGSTEGDGTGGAVDQFVPERMWAVQGVYGGNYSYQRQRTTDGGLSWQEIDNGIDPNTHGGRIRQDGVYNPTLYASAGPWVYESTNLGSNWSKANVYEFPGTVAELTASARATPGSVLYACIASNTTGERLYVRDSGVWLQRDFGLPAGVSVHTVATHPFTGNYTDEGWALMNGTGTPGQKVFHTTSRGVGWTNITGNLPDIPMGDLVADPWNSDRLFLGTALGCFKSTDGGATWVRWNNGLSDAVIVTVMTSIDTRGSGGPLYIVAGTYGRPVWMRDATGDDPAAVPQKDLAGGPRLFDVSPNPLSAQASLSFVLRKDGQVRVNVYDTGGRLVDTPVDQDLAAGAHLLKVDEGRLPAGTYFFLIEGDGGVSARTVTVVR
ncbi:MAG: hypothetical protein QUU85_00150 [Candidatus Eisenbacteria bacterium]|nr:hypothetical protein [Candidatus Eisenbacteria bacterium]